QGDFEAVVLEGTSLVHYSHSGTDWSNPAWVRRGVITSQATAAGSIMESSYGNLEVVALEDKKLVHYWHSPDYSQPWVHGMTISTQATGPGTILQSNYGTPGASAYEVLVPEDSNLVHYWHGSDWSQPWQRGRTVTTAATGPAGLMESNYGNLE